MAVITAVSLLTGRRGEHRHDFAQIGDVGVIVNGINPNKAYNVRLAAAYDLGIAAPGAPSTSATPAGGLTGDFIYRVRWVDANTGSYSLPGTEFAKTLSGTSHTLAQPSSPPARATNWIIERTTDGGDTFYPINVTSAAPYGTAIGTTTYNDNNSDETIQENLPVILEHQGVPPLCSWVEANGTIMFYGGGIVHRPTVTLTNGSANVSSADGGFVSDMVGWDLAAAGDTDGKTYKIATVTDANNIVLAVVYAGTTGTKEAAIAGPRNRVGWSEPGEPEHGGEQQVGTIQNQAYIGDDGEPLIGGCGLGPAGMLYFGERRMYRHRYGIRPNLQDGGRITPIETQRGGCARRAVLKVDGVVYGMDVRGCWRMTPDGSPQAISAQIDAEFRNNNLNFETAHNWHVGYDPYHRHVIFFVTESSDTYPKKGYVWSLERDAFVGTVAYPWGVTCSIVLPDSNGAERLNLFNELSGAAPSYMWTYGIGNSMGADPAVDDLAGDVTGGSTTTLSNSGAAWPTTGQKLKSVPVKLIRADGTEEDRIITDNTATALTVDSAWDGDDPADVDTYIIGALPMLYRSGRLVMGEPTKKKKFSEVWLWLKNDANAKKLYLKFYLDGSTDAYEFPTARDENGVAITEDSAVVEIDPAESDQKRFPIPLDGQFATDIQIEIYQREAGTPAEIQAIDIFWELEDRLQPTRK